MPGSTSHYALTTLDGGSFSYDGYKYTTRDREKIDQLLYMGAEGHVHDGATSAAETPSGPPSLSLSTSGGSIPGGVRVAYKVAYVNEKGEESAASAESFVITPSQIGEPSAPVLSSVATGGTLPAGNYYYVLSAYTSSSTIESRALNASYITVPAGTSTNEVTLTLPALPSGASGFNIYRRKPGQTRYFHFDTVDMNVATPPTSYVDDGSVSEDCDRALPTANSTNSTNSVTVTLPGATPAVPEGYTWKVYRTYETTYSASSLLHHVVETVSELDTTIVPYMTDVGQGRTVGSPRTTSEYSNSPSKINLTDGAHVEGILPSGLVDQVIHQSFEFPGTVVEVVGDMQWAFPFPSPAQGRIIGALCNLGVGSAPASQSLIVDVNVNGASVYDSANRPRILTGNNVGTFAQTVASPFLEFGDVISCDVDQTGGGASPTDENLVITLVIHVSTGITTGTVYE